MSINFTGIKNVHVYNKTYSKEGLYLSDDGNVKRGMKDYREIVLNAQLTDDKDGNHLTEYMKAMPKGFENTKGKDIVNLHLIQFEPRPDDDDILCPHVKLFKEDVTDMIKLNGESFEINNDSKLPMASFLAHLTKRDTDIAGMSDNQKKYVRFINDAIHQKACDYLDV